MRKRVLLEGLSQEHKTLLENLDRAPDLYWSQSSMGSPRAEG